ncbi:putative HTH-type transcriptional regulator for conjugative element SXT [Magnetofaba australis IT-1]|uniref:Putative HTH-type transcriptional regulator for conjugative element SXT n=2 Tax=Magnetofaba TaxID=1472292 RepID=A0A1Y2K221_9PROT|nr:putative HTH-type transcriptional regulator for conjugative element SXT [Magnetofaba australis IT-1]
MRAEPVKSDVREGPGFVGRLPLISWVQAGNWSDVVDTYQPNDAETWIDVTKRFGENAFALRVVGDSMEPQAPEGSIILVDPARQAVNNSLVVARLDDEMQATFKQLIIEGGQYLLKPLNPRYPIMDLTGRPVTICGVVRQIVIDLD